MPNAQIHSVSKEITDEAEDAGEIAIFSDSAIPSGPPTPAQSGAMRVDLADEQFQRSSTLSSRMMSASSRARSSQREVSPMYTPSPNIFAASLNVKTSKKPPAAPSTVVQQRKTEHHPENYYDYPDQIVQRHEDLLDVREDLLGTRFRMQAIRKRVRTSREQTGEKEGYAIKLVREYLHHNHLVLPRDVEQAWSQVDTARDELGILEGEFGEIEVKYHDQENRYTEQEGVFVESLVNNGPPSSDMIRPGATVSWEDSLVRFAEGDTNGWMYHTPSLSKQHPQISSSGASQHQADAFTDPSSPLMQRPVTADDGNVPRLTTELMEKYYAHALVGHDETKAQIDNWMFRIFEISSFARATARVMYPQNNMNDEQWRKLAEQTWTQDSAITTLVSTEFATFSQGVVTRDLSAAEFQLESENGVLIDPLPRSILPEEQNLAALDDPSVARSIWSEDLRDIGLDSSIVSSDQKEGKVDTTRQSVYTDPLTSSHTFSNGDDHTFVMICEQIISGVDHRDKNTLSGHMGGSSSSLQLSNDISTLPRHQTLGAIPRQDGQIPSQESEFLSSTSVPETKPASSISALLTPGWPTELVSGSSVSNGSDISEVEARQPSPLPSDNHSPEPSSPRAHKSVSFALDLLPTPDSEVAQATSQPLGLQSPEVPKLPNHQLYFPLGLQSPEVPKLPNHQLYFPFPFLRLNGPAVPQSSQAKKSSLPFVSVSESPVRLPGPASEYMFN